MKRKTRTIEALLFTATFSGAYCYTRPYVFLFIIPLNVWSAVILSKYALRPRTKVDMEMFESKSRFLDECLPSLLSIFEKSLSFPTD